MKCALPLVVLVLATSVALAAERFPPPEFTDHVLPPTTTPPARTGWLEYLDLAALAGALVLASYLALVKRSRRGLFLLSIASLAWLGFWRKGCVCPIGAIQNVSLAIFDPTYAIPLVVVGFFVLPLVFTLFFGRTFCASVCPLGAVQEMAAVWPIRVPAWLDQGLGLLAYVYLGAAVVFAATGTAFVICRYDPFVAFFRLTGGVGMLILGACFLVAGLFVGRPYCRYLCPMGAILAPLAKLSKWHVKIPPQECIQCRLCQDVCPYGAILEPTVPQSLSERLRGRWRLAGLIALSPLVALLGAWLGGHLAVPLSRLHPTFRLAERVWLEETGQVEATIDASDAFRNTARPATALYGDAQGLKKRFALVGGLLGAWVGVVVAVKLIHLSIRRRRSDFQPDRGSCVSCGRCFWYCPNEQARLGLIQLSNRSQ